MVAPDQPGLEKKALQDRDGIRTDYWTSLLISKYPSVKATNSYPISIKEKASSHISNDILGPTAYLPALGPYCIDIELILTGSWSPFH